MTLLYANCGINCAGCGAYQATQANSDEKRKEVAAEWSKAYGHEFDFKDINCNGCRSEGVLFSYCGQCEIRACVNTHKLENCAHCSEYTCEKLDKFLSFATGVKENLEAIRATL